MKLATLCALLLCQTALTAAADLVASARAQIGKTTSYDPSYLSLAYPGGDPPQDRGVCTDVVIRAMRSCWSMDLQKLVHEDMKAHFSKYPKNWGLTRTDRNIDHRRVPNLMTYFKRKGYERPLTQLPQDYQPGDIVTCIVPPHLPHIMIVSDQKSPAGVPLVIHNIGGGAAEEDRLFAFKLSGHYRVKAPSP
jgi:uncharacterized protein